MKILLTLMMLVANFANEYQHDDAKKSFRPFESSLSIKRVNQYAVL